MAKSRERSLQENMMLMRRMQIVSDMRSRESMLRNIGLSSRSFCPSMRRVNRLPFIKKK